MSDNTVQMIRTLAHTLWGAVIGLAVVDDFLTDAGLDPEWAKGAAVALSVGVIVAISQRLPGNRAGQLASTAISVINRPPAYDTE